MCQRPSCCEFGHECFAIYYTKCEVSCVFPMLAVGGRFLCFNLITFVLPGACDGHSQDSERA